jgi:hypothetical protein
VKRRNLTAGQRAIAAAEAWDRAPKNLGGGKGTAATLAAMFGTNRTYIEQARALTVEDHLGAQAVKAGASLKDAYDALQARQGTIRNLRGRTTKLRETRPDLAEKVEAGDLTIEAAEKKEREEADELKQQRLGPATSGAWMIPT